MLDIVICEDEANKRFCALLTCNMDGQTKILRVETDACAVTAVQMLVGRLQRDTAKLFGKMIYFLSSLPSFSSSITLLSFSSLHHSSHPPIHSAKHTKLIQSALDQQPSTTSARKSKASRVPRTRQRARSSSGMARVTEGLRARMMILRACVGRGVQGAVHSGIMGISGGLWSRRVGRGMFCVMMRCCRGDNVEWDGGEGRAWAFRDSLRGKCGGLKGGWRVLWGYGDGKGKVYDGVEICVQHIHIAKQY